MRTSIVKIHVKFELSLRTGPSVAASKHCALFPATSWLTTHVVQAGTLNSLGQLVSSNSRLLVVLCEYSKFRIESNSYLLFDSIRNWRNYSKFSNTYLTVISPAIDKRFVCTLPATSRCTHLSVEPSAAPRVFLPLPLPWVPWPRTHARELPPPVRACVVSIRSRPWHLNLMAL